MVLRRELLWAGTVLIQIPLIVSLTALGGFLLRQEWFGGLFRIPSEAALLPALLGIASTGPMIVAVSMVWLWQLGQRSAGHACRAGAVVHVAAAFLGALVSLEAFACAESGRLVLSPALFIPCVPLAAFTFCLLYWPRLALRCLRAG